MAGYRAKKRLGQHFLTSETVISRIVALVPCGHTPIIEIGPGRGALTLPLARAGADLTAVEFDRDLIGYLTKLVRGFETVTLVHQDFLTFEPESDRYALVGNLPYNLTSPVIDWCQAHKSGIESAVFMIQREPALRLVASPGEKAWSPLSIMTQLHFDVTYEFDVPQDAFRPPPEVVSAVIRLIPKEARVIEDMPLFERVIRSAFAQRRKLLAHNLAGTLLSDLKSAREFVERCGFAPDIRAEQLSIDEFLTLTGHLKSSNIV